MNFASSLVSSSRRGITLGVPWLDPNTSFTIQPHGALSANDWLHGIVPWWNPYLGAGAPLAGEMQSISLFLPFVLLLRFANGAILLKIALQMVSGLATYALARQLRLGRLAAFAAAVIYEFSGPLAWFAHAPITPVPFLPLALLGVELAFASAGERSRGGWALLGLALAYSLYAGFPETAFLNGLLVLVWAFYRLVVASPNARLAFARKIILGGVGGILLSAPIVLPFLEYLRLSGMGHGFYSDRGLPKVGLAGLLMPYIFGPIDAFTSADATGDLRSFWGDNGGYLDLTLFFVATLALFSGRRARGLRILLAVWMAVFLARVMGVPHVGHILNFIPGVNLIAVYRYCEPSITMAAAILAAYALDDWRQGEVKGIASIFLSLAGSLVLAFTAVWLASPLLHILVRTSPNKHFSFWLWSSLGWAFALTIAMAILYSRQPRRRTVFLVGGLVLANAVVLFAIPPLSGTRNTKLDFGLVAFLKQHLGLERFYTLGPFSPNYGAYFELASINHNINPIPADWVRYIQATLDPITNPSLFIGYFPEPASDREKALRTHLAGFEATAVKYVLVKPGSNPFVESVTMRANDGKSKRILLQSGESVSGVLPTEFGRSGYLLNVGVLIGIYGGAAKGQLKVDVCTGDVCASGIKSLATAVDRQRLDIPFETPLHVNTGDTVRYTFTHLDNGDSTHPNYFVFLWLWPSEATGLEPITVPDGGRINYTPDLTLNYGVQVEQPKLVYRGQAGDIFELPHPANYFEARGGPCELSANSRESVHASCKAPAVLIRRELSYPGWRAVVNGQPSPIKRFPAIFQTVDLPKGESTVSFSYQPSNIGWAWTSAVAGLICLGFGLPPGGLRSRYRRASRSVAPTIVGSPS